MKKNRLKYGFKGLLNKKYLFLFCGVALGVLNFSTPTYASNIYDIAKDFIKKTDPVYKKKIEENPLDQIPDGGTLLLRPRSQKIEYENEIYALKKNNKIYLAFEDVIGILDFAVEFDNETGIASGWFIREDWMLDVDFEAGRVIAKNVSYQVSDRQIVEQDGLLFVEGDALARWFGLDFDYNVKDQIINIESSFPLPSVARNLRQSRNSGNNNNARNVALLPRYEQEKSNFDINTADVFIGSRFNKNRFGNQDQSANTNVILEGEVLKHNAYVFAAADTDNSLTNVVARLSKRSETPTLLGALKARSYAVGDIDVTTMPLAGSVSQDLGFRFDNNTLENTDFASTDIEGDSTPGWDIQLYRNDVLIDTQMVGDDGRYSFNNIQLFIGENNFELFFFGPQGEVRSEQITVPVNQELLQGLDGTYEVSTSFENTQTYQGQIGDDVDRGSPHFAAKYNKLIGQNSLGFLGFRTRELGGDRKFYGVAGLSSTLNQTLLDTNFAVDEAGEIAGEIIARRRIAGWDVSAFTRANTDGYIIGEAVDPLVLEVGFNAQRSVNLFGLKSYILTSGRYFETADGFDGSFYDFGVSNNILNTNVSNRLVYEDSNIGTGLNEEKLNYTLSARKSWGKYFLRLATTYNITPDSELELFDSQINYRYNNKFSADLGLSRQFSNDLDIARLNLNYTHEKFRLTPFLQVDSNSEVVGGINLNFSLSDNPTSRYPDMSNRRYVGRGGVSTFVYHDKDGNLQFDGDDEPLEGAIVDSLNSRRRAPTGADGYANIRDLTTTQATDIVIDKDTLPDPFMIPATEGVSIFPDAGTIYNLEYPVHLTGEVEGYVYIVDEQGNRTGSSFHTLSLKSLDNSSREPITTKTERDGYYVLFNIPPGNYILTPLDKNKAGGGVARTVTIEYDGTIVQDVDFNLKKDASYIDYGVNFDRDDDLVNRPQVLVVDNGAQSELSKTLSKLVQQKYNDDPYIGLSLIKTEGEKSYYQLDNNDNETLADKCERLSTRNINCKILFQSY